LSERGVNWRVNGEEIDWIHATYTPGLFGAALRFDREGQIADANEQLIEPLMDGTFNNVAAAKAGIDEVLTSFQQTDAYGRLINLDGAVADLGSFAWRGREGSISFRFLTHVDDNDPQVFRMGDRPYDATTGRFTQIDRLVLAGMSPLAANRYIYGGEDPVNRSDPSGFEEFNYTGLQVTVAIQARLAVAAEFEVSFEFSIVGTDIAGTVSAVIPMAPEAAGAGAVALEGGGGALLVGEGFIGEIGATMCRITEFPPGGVFPM
jgi:RHS repeat-associated protein